MRFQRKYYHIVVQKNDAGTVDLTSQETKKLTGAWHLNIGVFGRYVFDMVFYGDACRMAAVAYIDLESGGWGKKRSDRERQALELFNEQLIAYENQFQDELALS